MACKQGEYERATALCRESLMAFQKMEEQTHIIEALEVMGRTVGGRGDTERAIALLGAADTLRRQAGGHLPEADRAVYERALDTLRSQAGEAPFAAAWARGQAMTRDRAIAYALN